MEKQIKKYIDNLRKKRFETDDLEKHLIRQLSGDYEENGGYREFARILRELEEMELIKPVRSRGTNSLTIPLANCYQKVEKKIEISLENKKKLMNGYHPKMVMTSYLNDYALYEKDRLYLDAIDRHLRSKDVEEVSINERSFQLFRDEKWLTGEQAKHLMQRILMDIEKDLNCYITWEPFFYYKNRRNKNENKVNILIIENKDTFFSLKSLMRQGMNEFCRQAFDMLIYGEGWKITKSIHFLNEIEELEGLEWKIYYFGDIDPEGLAIYSYLYDLKFVSIEPFIPFYQKLIDLYEGETIIRKKEQRKEEKSYQNFIDSIDKELMDTIKNIINNGAYLPQEGLSKAYFMKLVTKKE